MTTTEKEYVLKQIDDAVRDVWGTDIASDYQHCWIWTEDSLKNAMYHHLRDRLMALMEQYDVRIFTEFTGDVFGENHKRPDMVIAEIEYDDTGAYSVKECLCVIELKYKVGFHSHYAVLDDYEKLRYYCEDLKVDCPMYMATIWEYEDDETTWIRKNAAWAKDRVTELNASYDRESKEMRFYIGEH